MTIARGVLGIFAAAGLVVATAPPVSAKEIPKLKVKLIEFKVKPAQDFVAKGKTNFVVKNGGAEKHELVVVRANDPSDLPTKDDGSVDEKQIAKRDQLGEIEEFKAGKTKTRVFKLSPGSYVLFCNIVEEEDSGEVVSHFKEGMATTIEAS